MGVSEDASFGFCAGDKTKINLNYVKRPSSYHALAYKNQSVNAVQ